MPPRAQARPSRRVQQCCYFENGRRCRRSATGDGPIPLCNPHTLAAADAMRQHATAGSGVGNGIYNLFDRVVSGRKVNRRVLEDAVGDVAAWWEQYQASRPAPDPNGPRPSSEQPRWDDPLREAWRRAQDMGARARARAQRPPPDPREAQLAEARQRARITLGFTPREPLTEAAIKGRQKELARKHHPDRGGSTAKMAAINDAADVLLASLS